MKVKAAGIPNRKSMNILFGFDFLFVVAKRGTKANEGIDENQENQCSRCLFNVVSFNLLKLCAFFSSSQTLSLRRRQRQGAGEEKN